MSSLGTNFLQSTTTAANSALKAANNMSEMFTNSTSTMANSALKAANSLSDIITNSTSTIAKNISLPFNSSPRILNSLMLGPTGAKNNSNNSNNYNGTGSNVNSTTTIAAVAKSSWSTPITVFILLVLVFLGIFTIYGEEIKLAISNLFARMNSNKTVDFEPEPPIVTPPTPSESSKDSAMESKNIFNKILSGGQKEVFNVSDNEYTYYDAEPLCRALGAELATYGQVKEAWEKGADWCNYGWVKGQAAVYPTQKETWDKLQHGPEDEKYACGNPGLNGGFFDNPEMKFGVTCYGNKPPESSNDEKLMMENGKIPRTPATLKIDRQIQEYRENIDTIGLLPFNGNTWSG